MLIGRADTLLRLILLEVDFLLDKDIPVLQRGESVETISEIGKLQVCFLFYASNTLRSETFLEEVFVFFVFRLQFSSCETCMIHQSFIKI